MRSVFGGEGRRYYMLVHKVSSRYHKAGESQRIIVDQIEIGRDPKCQVRFDESFATVSRRHAAIVKDGDNWKLVQLSKTNSTYLNGHRVEKEWYLQNGDEIQLSTNGPKLGFIVPEGEKGKVSSIGLTARLNLFRKQALRPYKNAIVAMVAVMVVGLGGAGIVIHDQSKEIDDIEKRYAAAQSAFDSLVSQNASLAALMAQMKEQSRKQDSIIAANQREIKEFGRIQSESVPVDVAKLVESVASSVYYVVTTVYMAIGNDAQELSSSGGTGFLLSDGRFVTARHCVESWVYAMSVANLMAESYPDDVVVWSEITAYGPDNDKFTFKSTDFTMDRSKDVYIDCGVDEYGNTMIMRFPYYLPEAENALVDGTDWAVAETGRRGTIEIDAGLSVSLTQGTEVHVLGFPAGLGVADGQNLIEPIYNKMNVARNGLNAEGCIMVSQGSAHGNSGGPVFCVKDGKLYAIAIVSALEGATQQIEEGVVIQQQQQYDQLVPIKNIQ